MLERYKSITLVLPFVVFALACSGSESKPSETTTKPAAMTQTLGTEPGEPTTSPAAAKALESGQKKVLMVIAPKDFRDEELFETRKKLENAGLKVILASINTEEATGMLGGKAQPDMTITEAKAEDYDAVVFVGGSGTKALVDNEDAFSLARKADGAGKIVAAICIAPEILANAGLLNGKRATSWSGSQDALRAKGAEIVDSPVVSHDRIITGNGPSASAAFGEAIAKALSK